MYVMSIAQTWFGRSTAYGQMISLLRAIKADGSKGAVANALASLRVVVRFIDSDPQCLREGLAGSLETLSLEQPPI